MERNKLHEEPKGTPLTDDVVAELVKKGYSATDLTYLGHFTKEAVLAFTPKAFSEMADLFADHDDNLLGS